MKRENSILLDTNISSNICVQNKNIYYLINHHLQSIDFSGVVYKTTQIEIVGRNIVFWNHYFKIDGNRFLFNLKESKLEEIILSEYEDFYIAEFIDDNLCRGIPKNDFERFFFFRFDDKKIVNRFYFPKLNRCFFIKNINALYIEYQIKSGKLIESLNFLTGETLWQRSFKELGIANLDKFIGDINNILICACGKTILGLDKNTGEELWRVNHYTEVANAVLNQASGSIYLFYGWSGPENNFSENDNITFLEIEAQTGKVLYDNSIFKHPNYLELNGLRHYEGTGDYPRFYNALQWKHKIYFIINSWHSSMVKIMEFDTVNKRISYLTEQSYEANSNSNWFIAEGKLFIQSRISQQIESEKNPDPLYWSKIYNKSQFDGEQMHYQHFAISKESYLTIFDLEDN